MDPNKRNNKEESVSIGSWIATAVMLSAFFPVGIVLLIANLAKLGVFEKIQRHLESARVRSTFDSVKDEVRSAAARATAEAEERAEKARQRAEAAKTRDEAAKRSSIFSSALKRSKRNKFFTRAIAVLALAIGIPLALDGGGALINYGMDLGYFVELSFGLAGLAGGAVMLLLAALRTKNEKLCTRYHAIIGANRCVDIGRISTMIPCSYRDAMRDLQGMIDDGYFEPSAYIDHTKGMFYTAADSETADYVSGAAASTESKKAEATPESTKTEYTDTLHRIRALNARISDTELSAKIEKIEYITGAIFSVVERRPEKLPQIRSFMSYYLPTTLKLLDSYAQFEEQGIEGENLSAAKKSIEGIMDNLVAGFEKQLDSLFQDEAMDVSSDIEVLETMMSRDGVLGSSFDEDFFGGSAVQKEAE